MIKHRLSLEVRRRLMKKEETQFLKDVSLGEGVLLMGPFINLYGCTIGVNTKIGAFVEIQNGVQIGARCKISSHTFIPEGVTIGDDVFIGHGVMFINDKYPKATGKDGKLEERADWDSRFLCTTVESGVSVGTNATILGGVRLGKNSLVGAGSVVTKDVPAGVVVAGNPARIIKKATD